MMDNDGYLWSGLQAVNLFRSRINHCSANSIKRNIQYFSRAKMHAHPAKRHIPSETSPAHVNKSLILTVYHPDVCSMSFTEDRKYQRRKKKDVTCFAIMLSLVNFLSTEYGQEKINK